MVVCTLQHECCDQGEDAQAEGRLACAGDDDGLAR